MFTELSPEELYVLHEKLDHAWWKVWMKSYKFNREPVKWLRELGAIRAEIKSARETARV